MEADKNTETGQESGTAEVEGTAAETNESQGLFRKKAFLGIIPLAVIALVFNFFFLDSAVKGGINLFGSLLTDTRTEVVIAAVSSLKLEVEADKFTLVDPEDITKHMVTADTLAFAVEPTPLLEKKVHIKTIKVEGVRWNEPRPAEDIEKEIKKKKELPIDKPAGETVEAEEESSFDMQSIIDDISKRAEINPDELATVQRVQELSNTVPDLIPAYRKRLEAIKIQERTEQAQAVIASCAYLQTIKTKELADPKVLKKAGKDLGKLDQALKDMQKLENEISMLTTELQKEMDLLETHAGDLQELQKQDKAMLADKFKVDALPEAQAANLLFGPTAGSLVNDYLPVIKKTAALFPNRDSKKPSSIPGTDGRLFEFGREGDLPALLIEEISFSGEREGIAVEGRLTGITSNPRLHGKPSTLYLTCSQPAFVLEGTIDRTMHEPHDSYKLHISAIDPAVLLPVSAGFPFTIAEGTAEIKGSVERTGAGTSCTINLILHNIRLEGSSETQLMQLIKTSVENTPAITASLNKQPGKPMQVSSNLDEVLNESIRNEMKQLLEAERVKAESAMEAVLKQSMGSWQSQTDQVQNEWDTVLEAKTAPLQKLQTEANAIRKEFKAKKKKAEKELKSNLLDRLRR